MTKKIRFDAPREKPSRKATEAEILAREGTDLTPARRAYLEKQGFISRKPRPTRAEHEES